MKTLLWSLSSALINKLLLNVCSIHSELMKGFQCKRHLSSKLLPIRLNLPLKGEIQQFQWRQNNCSMSQWRFVLSKCGPPSLAQTGGLRTVTRCMKLWIKYGSQKSMSNRAWLVQSVYKVWKVKSPWIIELGLFNQFIKYGSQKWMRVEFGLFSQLYVLPQCRDQDGDRPLSQGLGERDLVLGF